MLTEIIVDLDARKTSVARDREPDVFGKALAVKRIIESQRPEQTVYLSGYTPLAASGLGFAGKLNVYGVSLLGNNLQGSRSGGLVASYLTRLGIAGIEIRGNSDEPLLLIVDKQAVPRLVPLAEYGGAAQNTLGLAQAIYRRHGEGLGLALTDPSSLGFNYNAVVCNTRRGGHPNRVAGRSTSVFGRNGLLGVVVEHAPEPLHALQYDRREVSALLRKIHGLKRNVNLVGSADLDSPLLGGTYGAAAKARFDNGLGLTNLFRSADVPPEHYQQLLPETIVADQVKLAQQHGIKITRHSCIPGCPNKCLQMVLMPDEHGEVRTFKAGEWETYQGVINLGIFDQALSTASWVIEHSNEFAYDHIEGLVTMAALALATEYKRDSGVRYGDRASIISAFEQAAAGQTELGRLVRQGAAAVERHYGLERHFTVGGHALPFHNGRSMLQTGVGLSWTYGRHGEACAGPGRQNFLGLPYDPADHSLDAQTHVLNTIHGIVLYGALDEMGMCFFIGPSVDTLVDCELLLHTMGIEADARTMLRDSARTILSIHDFNAARGASIQPLPQVFYDVATRGNQQTPDQAVRFNVPFEVVRDFGRAELERVASGETTVVDQVLETSRSRHA
ncbi:MAG: aldehyde ferredoxin oxidoreductase C-terminal domain-containing protein [Candidatus Alcyoniella australis]|nr:aldehyde ferredoxin oxidoreductase C-terminal domain-containing protein [Candidatus Alcyoniella australis]